MKGNHRFSAGSSLLTTVGGLVLLGLGLVISLRFDAPIPGGIFLFFLILSLVARFWSRRAIGGVKVALTCTTPRLFPGQTTTLTYRLSNDKFLPLPWLEVSQNGPEGDCLVPDGGFVPYQAPGTMAGEPLHLRRSFSYVGPYQTLTVDTQWQANRRGLYPITQLTARTGDGFGLVQREYPLPRDLHPTLAVYPRQVEVDLSLFLLPQWDSVSGGRGWQEDNTVLRSTREYQPGDNWKHINWRMAAREQGVPVNLYETVQPRGIHFVLDGESFVEDREALESALEVLGSLITGLTGAGLECSLTLPQSRRYPPLNLKGGEQELLLHLAGYQCLGRRNEDNTAYLPSLFPAHAIPRQGLSLLLTRSGAKLPRDILPLLEPGKSWVCAVEDWLAPKGLGLRPLSLDSLRKGGGKP